jgi:hypothetical protein
VETERDRLVHTLGNLTLLTGKLNSKVSNAAWNTKRAALQEHDVLKLNVDLLGTAGDTWTDAKIRGRTDALVTRVLAIWPVPEGHRSAFAKSEDRPRHRVSLVDLIAAGLIEPGATVYARRKAMTDRTATILPDGRLDVDGQLFDTPSGAARSIAGKSENGWWFFLLNPGSRRSLSTLFQEYVDQTSADVDEDEVDEEDDEDDDESGASGALTPGLTGVQPSEHSEGSDDDE